MKVKVLKKFNYSFSITEARMLDFGDEVEISDNVTKGLVDAGYVVVMGETDLDIAIAEEMKVTKSVDVEKPIMKKKKRSKKATKAK